MPRDKLIKMGFGDLNGNDADQSDYLSSSSVAESDFQVLVSDEFFSLAQDINEEQPIEDLSTCNANSSTASSASKPVFKLPKYDQSINYDSEFYNLFLKN